MTPGCSATWPSRQQAVGVLEIGVVYETARARRVTVDVTVAVPPDLRVERASTANGDVVLGRVVGDATVESANGDAIARNVDGFVTVRSANGDAIARGCAGIDGGSTANGQVGVDILAIRDDVSLASGNGDVEAAFIATLDAELVCTTGNGDIDVGNLDVVVQRDEPRRFEGTLGDGGNTITASSGNGDVDLSALD